MEKLSLSPDVGGTLPEILGYEKAEELIKEADNIYLKFGQMRRSMELTITKLSRGSGRKQFVPISN